MGSENSKSDDEPGSKRNQSKKEIRPRLYTEDEIQIALANQKRMFEAKQLEMQASSGIYPNPQIQNQSTESRSITSNPFHYSSGIYPNLQTQNQRTDSRQINSNPFHYRITPSAPPEDVFGVSRNTSVSRQTYQQTSSAQPPMPFSRSTKPPSSARPSHVTPSSAGPSNDTSFSAGPSNDTSSSAGPSHLTPSFAGPSYFASSSAGPSHVIPSSTGPSQVTNISAGPYKRNQKQKQTQRSRSRSRVNKNIRELDGIVKCVTCNGQLGAHIYQCTNGHSSCDMCRIKMARCGNCTELITNMRNITLESTLADITINPEERIKCSNAKDGCCLHFKREELQNHLKECPFNIITCPVMAFSGDCNWKGTIKDIAIHFSDAHPQHCEANVNKEMHIVVMELNHKVMHLVNIGFHKFLVHIQLDTALNNIYMVTQHLGTNFSASKWTYEWHVYNKKEPRRKFEYVDVCKSNATPVSEIINNNNCAVINTNYAKTFLDSGKLSYKFYIKKQFDNKKNIDTTSN